MLLMLYRLLLSCDRNMGGVTGRVLYDEVVVVVVVWF